MTRWVTSVLLLFAFAVSQSEAADRPAIPALIVRDKPASSFIVHGIVRLSREHGLAFYVASDGQTQVAALYDPADGTPLLLSDGEQTLVYDLENGRIVRVPMSRANVFVDWNQDYKKPVIFGAKVDHYPHPEKFDGPYPRFRIDRFADSAPLEKAKAQKETEVFAAKREDGYVESIEVDPHDPSWFRFASQKAGSGYAALELKAENIGQKLPPEALRFPDLKRLPAALHLAELRSGEIVPFVKMLESGTAKLALAGGPTLRAAVEKAVPKAEWAEMQKRDSSFGRIYREALAEQGIHLRTHSDPAATQQSR